MGHNKSMRKIIRYKTFNRRISSIVKHLENNKEAFYVKCGSQFYGWTVSELKRRMKINSDRIIFIRRKLLEGKRGT